MWERKAGSRTNETDGAQIKDYGLDIVGNGHH